MGAEEHLKHHGVQLDVLDDPECIQMMNEFIEQHAELWYEDIGE